MRKKFTSDNVREFHEAIGANALDTVRDMLTQGISPEVLHSQLPPLHTAASQNHVEVIDVLVRAGAKPARRLEGREGGPTQLRTALNVAAARGHLESVERLLDHGADPRSPGDYGVTALHYLVGRARVLNDPMSGGENGFGEEMAHRYCRTLGRMLDKGAQINQRDATWRTVLHDAVRANLPPALIEHLLECGADPHLLDKSGWSPLHYSCVAGRTTIFDILVRHGADVDHATADGKRALHICNSPGNFEAILMHSPNLNAHDFEGVTPLAWMLGTNPDLAKRLLLAGASLDQTDFEGRSMREIIKKKGNEEIAAFVAAQDARKTIGGVIEAARMHKPR